MILNSNRLTVDMFMENDALVERIRVGAKGISRMKIKTENKNAGSHTVLLLHTHTHSGQTFLSESTLSATLPPFAGRVHII